MAEVLHLLKEREFQKKVLPVRDNNLKIFSAAERVKYIEHWKTQVIERENLLLNLDITNAIEEVKKLKNTKKVNEDIGDFLAEIADMLFYTIEEEKAKSYDNILIYIRWE